ncbi:translation elongation factor Ts [Chitinispirillales bacterium ANBcel5]|uniref:translation elongation factor Ts n=1 Tax=Cellulosispirillum alkaliphilum TaxID=3039283 RepID=UPI002A4F03D3|nr:translation elongation factor Ts [Chitinispirillales bacterium ANBcel5]
MAITASQVKELRDKTGLGMMVCKQALIDSEGNMELAIENLRKQGQATAAKRAGKAAKEGKVSIISDDSTSILYEMNSETDFVARNEDFIDFIAKLGKVLITKKPADLKEALQISSPELGNTTIENRVTELIGKIGENISFRRYLKMDCDPSSEKIFSYIHGDGKIGVLVKLSLEKSDNLSSETLERLGKDLAMQVAAAKPMAVDRDRISDEVIAKEKEIYFTQAQQSGKPEKIWDKIVEGKLGKFFQEVTLMEQGFIKNPELNVIKRVAETEKEIGSSIKVLSFARFELGAEG